MSLQYKCLLCYFNKGPADADYINLSGLIQSQKAFLIMVGVTETDRPASGITLYETYVIS